MHWGKERGKYVERSRVAVIIEDEEDVRELIAVVFRQAGFVTHGAPSGEDGVDLVRQHDPMVVTLDIEMADMDGFEAARRIRLFSDSYVIMLTGRDDEADAMMGLDNGADDYIVKPFRPRNCGPGSTHCYGVRAGRRGRLQPPAITREAAAGGRPSGWNITAWC